MGKVQVTKAAETLTGSTKCKVNYMNIAKLIFLNAKDSSFATHNIHLFQNFNHVSMVILVYFLFKSLH